MGNSRHRQGFTLIETCLVLGLFLSMTYISLTQFNTTRESLVANHFFQNFEREVKLQHQKSLIKNKTPSFKYANQMIIFMEGNTHKKLYLPTNISVKGGNYETFTFTNTGHSSKTLNLPFQINIGNTIKTVTYKFKFGSGNFEKEFS